MKLLGLFLSLCFVAILRTKGGSSTPQPQGMQGSWASQPSNLWPRNESVEYFINPEFSEVERSTIKAAIVTLRESLETDCLSFTELKTKPDPREYINFIRIKADICRSSLGMQVGKPTNIQLGPECFNQEAVLHELLHALGAAQEHSRPDRNFYVSINWENIKQNYTDDFKIDKNFTETSQTIYDYFSITHYPRKAHSKNNTLDTITPRFSIGSTALEYKRPVLSAIDILEFSRIYECSEKESVKEEYSDYLDGLLKEVMQEFTHCNDLGPDNKCESYQKPLENLLEETSIISSRGLSNSHDNMYQLALQKHDLRLLHKEFNNTRRQIDLLTEENEELREENLKLKDGLNTQAEDMQQIREENQKLKEGLNTQAEEMQQLRDENKLLKRNQTEHTEILNNLLRYLNIDQGVFNKPWFEDPDVKIFNYAGYQVIEYGKRPLCMERFPVSGRGLNYASINSQAELDFITELLGDRKARIGGEVRMYYSDSPSYSRFFWGDGSSTQFFHTLEKKFKDGGTGVYYGRYHPWIQSGEIYFGGSNPDWIVCEYH